MDWKDVLTRGGWTFGEAFFAIYTAAEFTALGDFVAPALWEMALVAGGAALLSFAKTVVAQRFAATK